MTRRDPVTSVTDEELAARAEGAYDTRDVAEAWEDEEPPEISPDVRSVVSVRFSRGELGPIEQAAAEAGVPVSTYIRNAAINAVSAVDIDDARHRAEAIRDELGRLLGALDNKPGKVGRRPGARNRKASAA